MATNEDKNEIIKYLEENAGVTFRKVIDPTEVMSIYQKLGEEKRAGHSGRMIFFRYGSARNKENSPLPFSVGEDSPVIMIDFLEKEYNQTSANSTLIDRIMRGVYLGERIKNLREVLGESEYNTRSDLGNVPEIDLSRKRPWGRDRR